MSNEVVTREHKVQTNRPGITPKIIKEFDPLGNEGRILKVRLLQYQNPHFGVSDPKLDIREYLEGHENPDGTTYTGFTKKGVSLTWDDLQWVKENIDEILELMDSVEAEPKLTQRRKK